MKIGVDGGGTKTELILVDPAGGIVARHTGPGCNPSLLGPAGARDQLLALLQQLLAQAPGAAEVTATHLYMAGAPAFWRETGHELAGFGRVLTGDDSLPVLELATAGGPGLVLHAGTGSFVAARGFDGSLHYAGGLGWRFGDPGSGHDLGRRALAHGLLELQGWAPRTALADAVVRHTGIADYAANSRYFYTTEDANARIAAFAPAVLDLARTGNAPAQTAVAGTLTDFVALARQVTARLFGAEAVACGVSGAILNHEVSVLTLRALVATPPWPVELRFLADPPSEGVRRLLLRD
jgi:glucosamine kinase